MYLNKPRSLPRQHFLLYQQDHSKITEYILAILRTVHFNHHSSIINHQINHALRSPSRFDGRSEHHRARTIPCQRPWTVAKHINSHFHSFYPRPNHACAHSKEDAIHHASFVRNSCRQLWRCGEQLAIRKGNGRLFLRLTLEVDYMLRCYDV